MKIIKMIIIQKIQVDFFFKTIKLCFIAINDLFFKDSNDKSQKQLPLWLRDGLEKIKQEKEKKKENSKPEPIPAPKPVFNFFYNFKKNVQLVKNSFCLNCQMF